MKTLTEAQRIKIIEYIDGVAEVKAGTIIRISNDGRSFIAMTEQDDFYRFHWDDTKGKLRGRILTGDKCADLTKAIVLGETAPEEMDYFNETYEEISKIKDFNRLTQVLETAEGKVQKEDPEEDEPQPENNKPSGFFKTIYRRFTE